MFLEFTQFIEFYNFIYLVVCNDLINESISSSYTGDVTEIKLKIHCTSIEKITNMSILKKFECLPAKQDYV